MAKNAFTVLTLGCSKNVVDSENLIGLLEKNELRYTEDISEAESVIINTCGFIKPSKEESVNLILEAIEMKKEGGLKKIVVSGCLTERYKPELESQLPDVDIFFGVNSERDILAFLKPDFKKELLGERHLLTPGHFAYLKISEGCNHECAFCAIPLIRGNHISRPMDELLKEAALLAKAGVKELNVIAQDTTWYGKDIYGRQTIAQLLEELSKTDGIEWIKLMYAYPVAFPPDLLDVIGRNPKICNYLDIPFQHISDKMLKNMGRGSNRKSIITLIEQIRNKVPDAAIRSTFIVGFPGEKERDFNELCRFLEEYKLDRVGVFTYSHEDNTPAFALKDDVSERLKEERRDVLMEIQQKISHENNRKKIGSIQRVITDGKEDNWYLGRTEYDAPEVDNLVRFKSSKEIEAGTFVNVKINRAFEYELEGKIVL